MDTPEQKLVQYLMEARAMEHALVRVLQAQIAMTPRGSYRSAIENHLNETRRHADLVGDRLRALDPGFNPVTTIVGFWEDVFGQTVALGKAPFDLLRGTRGEEKVLKNAKDACASESLEIATYTAIEQVARRAGDRQTAEMAADIRADEQRMLARVMQELPRLADAVVGAEVEGEPSFDATTTGAADAVRTAAREVDAAARDSAGAARKVPGVAEAEGEVRGAVASEDDLPLAGYDNLTVEQITERLSGLSQVDLAMIDAYERAHKNRAGVLRAIGSHLST
jgi:ferritin-like metal-binding protein YciE